MEDFVSFEIAKKLKRKEFNEGCYKYYEDKELKWSNSPWLETRYNDYLPHITAAPTISQVLKWLRDEKKLHIEFVGDACGYLYIVSDIPSEGGTDRYCSDYRGPNAGGTLDKYEDCALNAIQYVLDNFI